MNRKRVVLVVGSFPQLSETFIVNKFIGLVDRGWDTHIVCQRFSEENWRRYESLSGRTELKRRVHVAAPVQPRWVPVGLLLPVFLKNLFCAPLQVLGYISRGLRRWGLGVAKRFYLESTILRLQPDVVHYEFGALALERLGIKELLDCRIVVSFRGYDLNYVGLDRESFYEEVWEKADVLHFLGKDLWRRAIRRGCPPDKPHVLIPPAINPEDYPRAENQSRTVGGIREPFCILSVGRLEWKKGYEFALEAVRKLVEKGVQCDYTVVGNGSYLECVAFARHQLDLEHVVKLTGGVDPSFVKRYLEKADVFLHAAVSEGFCNAVLEAQASGVPVVCTDADGLAENVADGKTGFVVPRRNPAQMADKLMLLAKQPELRRRMGEAGRERARTLFTQEEQIAEFIRLYESVCIPPPSKRRN